MPSEGNLGFSAAPGTEGSKIVPLPLDGTTSSEQVIFEGKPVSLAIPHLIGCTSIIVVSKKGAWANHIWERPTFMPEEEWIEDPNPPEGQEPEDIFSGKWYIPGTEEAVEEFPAADQLKWFTEHALGPIASDLGGLRSSGNIFADGSDAAVFMFMPTVRGGGGAAWDKGGMPGPRPDDGQADSLNDMIRKELKKAFGESLEINEVLYTPDEDSDPEDTAWENPSGRALVQYQPGDGNSCDNTEAKWRVFFEAATEPHGKSGSWEPAEGQFCLPDGNAKRQACEPDVPTDLPTLAPRPTGISTPPGSSCASTVTASECNMGACIPTPSCAEWIATTTAPPEEPTEAPEPEPEPEPEPDHAPWEEQAPSCNNEDDFRGHADISGYDQSMGSIAACANAPGFMGESSAQGAPYTYRYKGSHDINYDYQISWDWNCRTDSTTQELGYPLGEDGPYCHAVMMRAYQNCEFNPPRP